MRPLFRAILLWMMIVSIPLQGIAATIKSPCMMMSAHTELASSQTMDMDACDDQAMLATGSSASVETAGHAGDHEDMPCHKDANQKHASCRLCSACHAGAFAPPPFSIGGLAQTYLPDHYVSPARTFTGWIPSRIERPPRA